MTFRSLCEGDTFRFAFTGPAFTFLGWVGPYRISYRDRRDGQTYTAMVDKDAITY